MIVGVVHDLRGNLEGPLERGRRADFGKVQQKIQGEVLEGIRRPLAAGGLGLPEVVHCDPRNSRQPNQQGVFRIPREVGKQPKSPAKIRRLPLGTADKVLKDPEERSRVFEGRQLLWLAAHGGCGPLQNGGSGGEGLLPGLGGLVRTTAAVVVLAVAFCIACRW